MGDDAELGSHTPACPSWYSRALGNSRGNRHALIRSSRTCFSYAYSVLPRSVSSLRALGGLFSSLTYRRGKIPRHEAGKSHSQRWQTEVLSMHLEPPPPASPWRAQNPARTFLLKFSAGTRGCALS